MHCALPEAWRSKSPASARQAEVRAYIAIGSNIDPAENVRLAVQRLAKQARLTGISMVYRTAALGRPGLTQENQPPYYNCVAEIETETSPLELKRGLLRSIENSLGRIRSADKFAARTIDLDLIVYGDRVMDEAGLKLPDPEIMERPFLAIPLYELAPDMVLAGSKRRIAEIAAGMALDGMQPLKDYVRQLRKAIEEEGAAEFRP